MKARWTAFGVAIGLALALTFGFAFGSDGSEETTGTGWGTAFTQSGSWDDMLAVHDSPEMRRLHAQMPEDLQAQCDAMHAQMGRMMGPGGMMSGDMSSHHTGSGWGMDPGSTPGGMMGPGMPGGMMGT